MTHPAGTPGVVTGALHLGDDELEARILAGLSRVENLLRTELSHGDDVITDKVMHLVNAGGKRFRPMFALLAAQYGPDAESDDVVKAAALVEMTHLATLYHDDVMDESPRRRGVESANARWGNSVAILAGDHLLAQASGLMADLGVPTVRHFSETFGELVTGQMRETVGAEGKDPIEHYTKVIQEKTGVLIASAGYLGSLHAGAPAEYVDALRGYGRAVGVVFQIVDDIIDIYSTNEESGKERGTDLREGVFTLPVLHALAEGTPVGEELRGLLTGPLTADEDVARALALLEQSGGREAALNDVHHWIKVAESHISVLPDNATTRALRSLAQFTVQRVG